MTETLQEITINNSYTIKFYIDDNNKYIRNKTIEVYDKKNDKIRYHTSKSEKQLNKFYDMLNSFDLFIDEKTNTFSFLYGEKRLLKFGEDYGIKEDEFLGEPCLIVFNTENNILYMETFDEIDLDNQHKLGIC